MNDPITPAWLRSIGFRLDHHHVDNQPHMKLETCRDADQWLEVSPCRTPAVWTVFLRSDMACVRSRFVWVRYVTRREQLVALIVAITDRQPETVEFDAAQFEEAWAEEAADCLRRYREWSEGGRWPR